MVFGPRRTPGYRRGSRGDRLAVTVAIFGAFAAVLDIQIIDSWPDDIEGVLGTSSDEGSCISKAYIMAYHDAFWIIGVGLVISLVFIVLPKKPARTSGPVEAH